MIQYHVSNFQRAVLKDNPNAYMVKLGEDDYGLYHGKMGYNSFGSPLMARGPLDELRREFPNALMGGM